MYQVDADPIKNKLEGESESETKEQRPKQETKETNFSQGNHGTVTFGDDFVYKIFFKDAEIEKTKDLQSKDLFQDLMQSKNDAILESSCLIGRTRVNILDFAPKPKKVISAITNRRISRRNRH